MKTTAKYIFGLLFILIFVFLLSNLIPVERNTLVRTLASEPDLVPTSVDLSSTQPNSITVNYNENIRNMDFFKRQVETLATQNSDKPPAEQNKADYFVAQNSLLFDYELGPTHPARSEFLKANQTLFESRDNINKKLVEGSIDADQAKQSLAQAIDNFRYHCIRIFSDSDYEKLFHNRKTADLAGSLGLTK